MPSIRYNAPKGDSPHVTYMGVDFFDGTWVNVNKDERPALIEKVKNNPFFEIGAERGRPPKADAKPPKADANEAGDSDGMDAE